MSVIFLLPVFFPCEFSLKLLLFIILFLVTNKPCVAGAVLQSPLLLVHKFNNLVSLSFFSSQSSNHYKSQTVKARDLTCSEKVHLHQRVMCHMSYVTCHNSHVTCHMSHFLCYLFLFIFWLKFVGKGSVINGA